MEVRLARAGGSAVTDWREKKKDGKTLESSSAAEDFGGQLAVVAYVGHVASG